MPSGARVCAPVGATVCTPSGTTVCAAIGIAAQTHQRIVEITFSFMLYEQFVDWGSGNKRWSSERSRLLVLVGSSRRCVYDFLGPIDAQSRVNRRHDMIHHGLLFEFPARFETFR